MREFLEMVLVVSLLAGAFWLLGSSFGGGGKE